MSSTKPPIVPFSSYQKLVVAILAFLQFTVILDFMIMSPLGAVMMPALDMQPSQFGVAVSVYAFSAGIAGLLAAGFADKYDRKKILIFFYSGFVLGTFLCGIANTYHFLLLARMVTGLFGGVVGSTCLAITTDLFPLEMRGRVMGLIQTAFAGSQILGLPIGLFLSNHWGWHAPFLMIVVVSSIVGVIIWTKMKPIDAHLKLHPDRNPVHHLIATVSNRRYLFAFGTTALLSLGGFMLMPFGSAFTVHNMGIDLERLPLIYLITGMSAMVMGPIVGRLCDRIGKYKTFVIGSLISITMVLIYTSRGITPLPYVILINVILFMGIFSRMIPAQALMSAIPDPSSRGAFMSVSSSLQQISGGIASVVAGLIVVANPDGSLLHFNVVGYVMLGTVGTSMFLMYFIHRSVQENVGKAAPTIAQTAKT